MTAPMRFRDLDVWQRGMDLVDQIYKRSRDIPQAEFDLRRQMRRASVSIPSNVAEGFRRKRQQAYQNHVSIAMGSHGELETLLEVAFRNDFLSRAESSGLLELLDRVGGMLYRLHESLGQRDSESGNRHA